MHRDPLEEARTDYSCFLACIVSVARERGFADTQESLIEGLRQRFPEWEKEPGALNIDQAILLMVGLFHTHAHSIVFSKKKIIELWRRSERFCGFLITTRQPDGTGKTAKIAHAWRITDCDENKLRLMNPQRGDPTLRNYKWSLMPEFQARALIVEGWDGRNPAAPTFDPYQ